MSVLKRNTRRRRHVGRRVAVVAAGVALIVVGLEAPAFAAVSISGFSPASGPVGCVVVITGTDFNNPNVTAVAFNATPATDFTIISGTEIWATVPAGATNGPIRVTNSVPQTVSSATGFTVTGGAGDCAPTIDSFTPTCGPAGTDITITGTNLLSSTTAGAGVKFAPYGPGNASPVAGSDVSPTEISVNVPAGAADGPIQARTFMGAGGLATSTLTFDAGTCITDFQPQSGGVGTVVTITGVGFEGATSVKFFNGIDAIFQIATNTETVDTITATVPFGATTGPITVTTPGGTATTTDFTIGGGVTHPRNVTLKLSDKLKMAGKVKVPDGTTECANAVPVKLQRKKKGDGWKTLKTVTTDASGAYSGKVRNKPGKFRSIATKVTLDDASVCLKDVSPVRKN